MNTLGVLVAHFGIAICLEHPFWFAIENNLLQFCRINDSTLFFRNIFGLQPVVE